MACITEAAIGFPNASGTIPPENGMLSEILGEAGWNTYMVGKWHLCPTDEMNLAATRRNWPTGRGFERWYGFLGAETNQWYPDLVYDNHPVDQPRQPEEGYHFTDDITDKALEFIQDAKAIAPDKPFFLYYAPGACHAPHHAPKEWSDKFKGQFDMGYEAMREQTLARQKKLGIVPADTELPPVNPIGTPETRTGPDGLPFPELDTTRPWETLNADEKRLFARMAEVYAGFLAHADHHIGRLLDYLESTEQLENTMIIVVSDNGASGEGGPNGSVNEMKFANGVADDLAENLAKIDDLGSPSTYNHYPNGWAMAFNTPFKMWKRYEFNGGTSDPCIIAWPKGSKARGEIRDQYHHAIDIVPTVLDVLGLDAPEVDQGPRPEPVRRRQHARQLRRCEVAVRQEDAVLLDARLAVDLARGLEGRHDPPDHRRLGPLQRRRVGALSHRRRSFRAPQPRRGAARQGPRAGEHLVRRGRLQHRVPARRSIGHRDHGHTATPDDRAARPIRLLPRRRRRARVAGRQHPGSLVRRSVRSSTSPRPERRASSSPSVHGSVATRSTSRTTGCTTSTASSAASSRRSTDPRTSRPATNQILSASFDKDGMEPDHATGILTLYHGKKKVGEGRIKTQLGAFEIAGLLPDHRAGPGRGHHRGLPGRVAPRVHGRHDQSRRGRRQRRAVRRSRARSRPHADARVTP